MSDEYDDGETDYEAWLDECSEIADRVEQLLRGEDTTKCGCALAMLVTTWAGLHASRSVAIVHWLEVLKLMLKGTDKWRKQQSSASNLQS